MQELIEEFEIIKTTKCKTLQEMIFFDGILAIIESKYLEKEKEQMLNFYMWMRMNENTEKYLDYSDEDMFSEYLKQKI